MRICEEGLGFEFLETDEKWGDLTLPRKTVRGVEAAYGFDQRALTRNKYEAQFWVARRPGG